MHITDAMARPAGNKFTENGAAAFSTTTNYCLDLFSLGGAYRSRGTDAIRSLFNNAYQEDPVLATKILFYLHDIREGQGERRFFKESIHTVLDNAPNRKALMALIPEFGRWDTLIEMLPLYTQEVTELIKEALDKDLVALHKGYTVSLLGKWLPSENTSSKKTKELAKMVRKALRYSSKEYRKMLSQLRGAIKIVEAQISSNQWDSIEFQKLPSQALQKYKKAFFRHTPEKMTEYIEGVKNGSSKMNANQINLGQMILNAEESRDPEKISMAEATWKSLPNFVKEDAQALVVADTSASMGWRYSSIDGTAIYNALALAIYFGEKNVGPFHNAMITFSTKPAFARFNEEDTLFQKIRYLKTSAWQGSTDVNAVFKLILTAAKDYHVAEQDMPRRIIIISDMEFDGAVGGTTNLEYIKQAYADAGYILPKIVFWNVNARNDTLPCRENEQGVSLLSGTSLNTFKYALDGGTPLDIMYEVVRDNPRYDIIGTLMEVQA